LFQAHPDFFAWASAFPDIRIFKLVGSRTTPTDAGSDLIDFDIATNTVIVAPLPLWLHLFKIELNNTQLKQIDCLCRMPNLTTVILVSNMHLVQLDPLCSLHQLRNLSVVRCPMVSGDAMCRCVDGLSTSLRQLRISTCVGMISDFHRVLHALKRLLDLQSVDIIDMLIRWSYCVCAPILCEFENLKFLRIKFSTDAIRNTITNAHILPLNLVHLHLVGVDFQSSTQMQILKISTTIRTVNLSECRGVCSASLICVATYKRHQWNSLYLQETAHIPLYDLLLFPKEIKVTPTFNDIVNLLSKHHDEPLCGGDVPLRMMSLCTRQNDEIMRDLDCGRTSKSARRS